MKKNKEVCLLYTSNLSMPDLAKKRKYMRAVKDLSALKRELETAQVRLASLMGFHPSTEFKLVGKEYGNFELPEIKSSLDEMEWIALTNRPELRVRDIVTNVDEVKSYVYKRQECRLSVLLISKMVSSAF